MAIILFAEDDEFLTVLESVFKPLSHAIQLTRTSEEFIDSIKNTPQEPILACIECSTQQSVQKFISFFKESFPSDGHIFLLFDREIPNIDLSFVTSFSLPMRFGRLADKARTFLESRLHQQYPNNLDIGLYIFRPAEAQLDHKDTTRIIQLTEKERDILIYLFNAGPKGADRMQLLNAVWAYAEDAETHTLETHIYRLRQKIEQDPTNPKLLITDESAYKLVL